jgi:hypothetical protein
MTKENLIEDYEYDEELFGDINNSVPLHLYLFTENAQLKDAFNKVLYKCFPDEEINTSKRKHDRRKQVSSCWRRKHSSNWDSEQRAVVAKSTQREGAA